MAYGRVAVMTRASKQQWIALAIVLMGLTTACAEAPATARPATGHLVGTVTAGPICPVVRQPPDPACAARPVTGAVLIIRQADTGTEAARATVAQDGTYAVDLPAGTYSVEPQPVDGLLGTPGPQPVEISEIDSASLDFGYDTGIR